jgi:saccharopepsin
MAIEMSPQPFKSFNFDGIVGLGLKNLALAESFSYFNVLAGSHKLSLPQFGVFLSEGEDGEESEIAFGGYNTKRILDPLHFVPVAKPELGYWEVQIKAIRIDGRELDVCMDGTCRGVVDTGTSHIGVPAPYNVEVSDLLTRDAGDLLDCRLVQAPEVEIELPGINLTLNPRNYMRRLPLREGVTVGSPKGVVIDEEPAQSPAQHTVVAASEDNVNRQCTPRVTRVNLPEPLGPKLFILGEPILHRYYTVYDWANLQVGFSLSNSRQNTEDLSELSGRGSLPQDVEMLLMQETVSTFRRSSSRVHNDDDDDETMFIQVTLSVVVQRVDAYTSDLCDDSGSTVLALDM